METTWWEEVVTSGTMGQVIDPQTLPDTRTKPNCQHRRRVGGFDRQCHAFYDVRCKTARDLNCDGILLQRRKSQVMHRASQ